MKTTVAATRHLLEGQSHWLFIVVLCSAWWLLPGLIAAWVFLPLVALVAWVIWVGWCEAVMLRRRVWLGQYLKAESILHRWFRRGVITMLWLTVPSLALALVVLVSLRQLPAGAGAVLVGGLVLFVALELVFRWLFRKHVKEEHFAALVRCLVVRSTGALLVVALSAMKVITPQPYMVGISLDEAVQRHVVSDAGSSLLGGLERMAKALELTSFWLMQNTMEVLTAGAAWTLVGWILLFTLQGALAWSWVRMLSGTSALRDRAIRRGMAPRKHRRNGWQGHPQNE